MQTTQAPEPTPTVTVPGNTASQQQMPAAVPETPKAPEHMPTVTGSTASQQQMPAAVPETPKTDEKVVVQQPSNVTVQSPISDAKAHEPCAAVGAAPLSAAAQLTTASDIVPTATLEGSITDATQGSKIAQAPSENTQVPSALPSSLMSPPQASAIAAVLPNTSSDSNVPALQLSATSLSNGPSELPQPVPPGSEALPEMRGTPVKYAPTAPAAQSQAPNPALHSPLAQGLPTSQSPLSASAPEPMPPGSGAAVPVPVGVAADHSEMLGTPAKYAPTAPEAQSQAPLSALLGLSPSPTPTRTPTFGVLPPPPPAYVSQQANEVPASQAPAEKLERVVAPPELGASGFPAVQPSPAAVAEPPAAAAEPPAAAAAALEATLVKSLAVNAPLPPPPERSEPPASTPQPPPASAPQPPPASTPQPPPASAPQPLWASFPQPPPASFPQPPPASAPQPPPVSTPEPQPTSTPQPPPAAAPQPPPASAPQAPPASTPQPPPPPERSEIPAERLVPTPPRPPATRESAVSTHTSTVQQAQGMPTPSTPKPPPPPRRRSGSQCMEPGRSEGTAAPSTPKPPPSKRWTQSAAAAVEDSPEAEAGVQLISPVSKASDITCLLEASMKRKERSGSSESDASSESARKSSRAASHWAPSPIRDLSPAPGDDKGDEDETAQQGKHGCPTLAARPKSMVAKGPRTGATGPRCSLSWPTPGTPPPGCDDAQPASREALSPPSREVSTAPGASQPAQSEQRSPRRSGSNRREQSAGRSRLDAQDHPGHARVSFTMQGRNKSDVRGRRNRSSSRPHNSRKTDRSDSGSDSDHRVRRGFEKRTGDRYETGWYLASHKGKGKGKGKDKGKGKESYSGDRRSVSRSPIVRRRSRSARKHRTTRKDRYGRRRQRKSSSSDSSSSSSPRRARSSPRRVRSRSERFPRSTSARRVRSPRRSPCIREQNMSAKVQTARSRAASIAMELPVAQAPPRMNEPFLCFRQYIWTHVADSATIDEALQQFRAYDSSYRSHHAAIYFNDHKQDAVIKEHYDPAFSIRKFDLQIILSQSAAQELAAQAEAGTYKELSLTAVSATFDGQDKLVQKCEVAGHGSIPHFPFDPDVCTLSFGSVPAALSVWSLFEVMSQCHGFIAVWLTPGNFGVGERNGHARFKSSGDLTAALEKLWDLNVCESGYLLQPKRAIPRTCHQVGVVPCAMSEPEQIKKDLKLAGELISTWNAAKGIPTKLIHDMLMRAEGDVAKLDLSILYLRRVHNICYYSGMVCSNERELAERCGVTRLRAPAGSKQAIVQPGGNPEEAKWVAEHEARLKLLLQKGCELKRPEICYSVEEEPLRSRWLKQCQDDTLEVEEAKFRCKRCQKLFRGPEFVHKHLLKAHPELQMKLRNDINEELAREAFLADGNAVKSVPLPTSAPASAAVSRAIATPARQRRGNWDQ